MADTIGDGEFRLPSEFLTDDDILLDKENFNKNGVNAAIGPTYCFPTEFPYDFSSIESYSSLNSPVESVLGSTETESDGEDSLTGLTHRFARSTSTLVETRQISSKSYPHKTEKMWVHSGSPQSTLSAAGNWSGLSPVSSNGSPNGTSQLSSPTATILGPNNDAWDLIYAAAGHVARLKMNGEGPPTKGGPRSFTPLVRPSPPPVKNPYSGFYPRQNVRENQVVKQICPSIWDRPAKERLFYQQNQFQQQISQKIRECSCGCSRNGRFAVPVGSSQSSFPHLQVQNQTQTRSGSGLRPVFHGGSGHVKTQSSGTGVFLPRRYVNPNSDARKKQDYSTALLPARVVQSPNENFQYLTPHSFNGSLTQDYDALVVQRNMLLTQQKRINHEISLPQEWTY